MVVKKYIHLAVEEEDMTNNMLSFLDKSFAKLYNYLPSDYDGWWINISPYNFKLLFKRL